MGHTRLGELPKTRKWNEIVRLLGASDDARGDFSSAEIARIAQKTIRAARAGLEAAIDDPGLQHSFFLLTQIAVAGRSPDWVNTLAHLGIDARGTTNLFELSSRLHQAVDQKVGIGSTDLGEVAQKAAGEALIGAGEARTALLFGNSSDELTGVLKSVSTKAGFSQLGQKFFSRFIGRFLNSYLSRATAGQLGRSRLHQLGDISQFENALQRHCDQTARIVRDFCGDWYSKTEYEEGINPENTRRFIAVAIRKIRDELKRQQVEK